MASINYFDSSREMKSVMEMHVIIKSTNFPAYSCFYYTDN